MYILLKVLHQIESLPDCLLLPGRSSCYFVDHVVEFVLCSGVHTFRFWRLKLYNIRILQPTSTTILALHVVVFE